VRDLTHDALTYRQGGSWTDRGYVRMTLASTAHAACRRRAAHSVLMCSWAHWRPIICARTHPGRQSLSCCPQPMELIQSAGNSCGAVVTSYLATMRPVCVSDARLPADGMESTQSGIPCMRRRSKRCRSKSTLLTLGCSTLHPGAVDPERAVALGVGRTCVEDDTFRPLSPEQQINLAGARTSCVGRVRVGKRLNTRVSVGIRALVDIRAGGRGSSQTPGWSWHGPR